MTYQDRYLRGYSFLDQPEPYNDFEKALEAACAADKTSLCYDNFNESDINTVIQFMRHSFTWTTSPEGHDFWLYVLGRLIHMFGYED